MRDIKDLPIRVRNAENTSDDQDPDGNLNVWKEYAAKHYNWNKKTKCSEYSCFDDDDLVGAHVDVIEENHPDKGEQFIIPLCRSKNSKQGEEFDIKGDTILMPVDELNS